MNPFNMINIVNQYRSIKQNPSQLTNLLKQRGIISPEQAQDIEKMNGNYEQVGQYLMTNGCMPGNAPQQYQNDISQVQNMLDGKSV